MSNPKRQHFVPKCYLKGFPTNGTRLFAYDKDIAKQYQNSYADFCWRKDFYKINQTSIGSSESIACDPMFFESIFFSQNIEAKYADLLQKVRNKSEKWISSKDKNFVFDIVSEKELFAAHIAVQKYRLPWMREEIVKFNNQLFQKEVDIYNSFQAPRTINRPLFRFEVNEDLDSHYHSLVYANESLINATRDRLLEKCWYFFVSSKTNLYTSDNPILSIPLQMTNRHLFAGLGTQGARIIFPLSNTVLLVMYDKDQIPADGGYRIDCFNEAYPRIVFENQFYQYGFARRHVFSGDDDFRLIYNYRKRNGAELKINDTPKLRMY